MNYKTKEDACRAWVATFDAIPQRMALQGDDIWENWEFFGRLNDETSEEYGEEYGPVEIPMWGWFWMMSHSSDEKWLDENREAVADLGFTIIENYDEGWLLLGIDGAGYDFYDAHWLPLYDLRGMKWHEGAWDE